MPGQQQHAGQRGRLHVRINTQCTLSPVARPPPVPESPDGPSACEVRFPGTVFCCRAVRSPLLSHYRPLSWKQFGRGRVGSLILRRVLSSAGLAFFLCWPCEDFFPFLSFPFPLVFFSSAVLRLSSSQSPLRQQPITVDRNIHSLSSHAVFWPRQAPLPGLALVDQYSLSLDHQLRLYAAFALHVLGCCRFCTRSQPRLLCCRGSFDSGRCHPHIIQTKKKKICIWKFVFLCYNSQLYYQLSLPASMMYNYCSDLL